MSYHSALDADLREAGHYDDDGPPFEECEVCLERSQEVISGDCYNAACARMCALNQMDPPSMTEWLAALDTDGMSRPWQSQDDTHKIAA